MLQAYFDESGSENDSEWVVVAGGISSAEQWGELEREWRRLLEESGVEYFHMRKFVVNRGPFLGWDRKEPQRNEFMRRLTGIVSRRLEQLIGVALRIDDYRRFVAERVPRTQLGSPYALCGFLCFDAVGAWAEDRGINEEVDYIFEQGNNDAAELSDAYLQCVNHPDYRRKYRLGSFGWSDRSGSLPLQAADLIAWEFRKSFADSSRGIRRSFERLLDVPITGDYLDFAGLEDYARVTGLPVS